MAGGNAVAAAGAAARYRRTLLGQLMDASGNDLELGRRYCDAFDIEPSAAALLFAEAVLVQGTGQQQEVTDAVCWWLVCSGVLVCGAL